MKIACSSIIKSDGTLEEALALVSKLGFKYVDIIAVENWIHFNPSQITKDFEGTKAYIEGLLKKNNLELIALNSTVGPELYDRSNEANEWRIADSHSIMKLMDAFNIKTCTVGPRGVDSTRSWDEQIIDVVKSIREMLKDNFDIQKIFPLELHINSTVEKMDKIQKFMDLIPELTVAFDPSHFAYNDYSFEDYKWILDQSTYIHLRDASKGKLQEAFGEGTVDFDSMLGYLKSIGYTGDFAIEYMADDTMDVEKSAIQMRDKVLEYFPECEY